MVGEDEGGIPGMRAVSLFRGTTEPADEGSNEVIAGIGIDVERGLDVMAGGIISVSSTCFWEEPWSEVEQMLNSALAGPEIREGLVLPCVEPVAASSGVEGMGRLSNDG